MLSKYSSPSPGRTIINSIKEWSTELMRVWLELAECAKVMKIDNEIEEFYSKYLEPKVPVIEEKNTGKDKIDLMGNAVLSIWLTGVSTNYLSSKSGLYDSICWFFDLNRSDDWHSINKWVSSVDIKSLQGLKYDERFLDLYPYILEIFETHNELFLPGTQRTKKRCNGIYYTPSDVAEYMVRKTCEAEKGSYSSSTWIDPACGTGIFLRTIMEYYLQKNLVDKTIFSLVDFFVNHIYGIDISKTAVQSSTFTILNLCMSKDKAKITSPWIQWHKIRGNIIAFDSTKILNHPNSVTYTNFKNKRLEVKRKYLLIKDKPDTNKIVLPDTLGISEIFPEVENGFTYFVTNPPYSKKTGAFIQRNLYGEPIEIQVSRYPVFLDFIQMMWNFCHSERRSCCIVVPLSITFNSGKVFQKIREDISTIKGTWYFANFDRTPDSLFGDDVKTRNTIIFHQYDTHDKNAFFTTSLLRWNSRNRSSFFEDIPFVTLNEHNIKRGIPKISNEIEKEVYNKASQIKSILKEITSSNAQDENECSLYVGKTSYNWLSVYRVNPYLKINNGAKYSNIDILHFKSKEEADIIYGILCSRIVYWLWRVRGDGFHLTKTFIENLPIQPNKFSAKDKKTIITHSIAIWDIISQRPIFNNNSEVVSVTYCPYYAKEEIDSIDKVILEHWKAPLRYQRYFKELVDRIIVAGRESEMGLNLLKGV